MIIIQMFLAFFLAFQAGQMKTLIDLDKEDGRKSDWKLYFFCIADSLLSIYLIITIYGSR
jgi:hypothetical protein